MSINIKQKPLVSICCVTYNHENMISQCLEGFVMQQTTFPFEILVHEDASTDNTAHIIKEYETKYPHLFRCVYQTENQFTIQNTLTNILFPMAKGKYIAMCEGDDYWTDPYKLQKQVDFLEANEDYVICFSGYKIKKQIIEQEEIIANINIGSISIEQIIETNSFSTATTIFALKYLKPIPSWFSNVKFGDWTIYLLVLHASKKKAYCLEGNMAVYRIHSAGIHGNLHESNIKLVSAYKMHIDFYRQVQTYLFKNEYSQLINACIEERKKIIKTLLKNEKKYFAAMLSYWY